MADPKDPKYRKAETWQTGGIKVNEEAEKPQAPENAQNPSANALEAPSSAEGKTSQKALFLGEIAPNLGTEETSDFKNEEVRITQKTAPKNAELNLSNGSIPSNPKPWEDETGKLIGNRGGTHRKRGTRNTIREIMNEKSPEEAAGNFIEKVKQNLMVDGYVSTGEKNKGLTGKEFQNETFTKGKQKVTINLRKENASSKRTGEGIISVDLHNHPDILRDYQTNKLKLKFIPKR